MKAKFNENVIPLWRGQGEERCKYALRAKMMRGYTFNKRPVGNYIVDFVCKELLLAMEVDGGSHLLEETIVKDDLKDDYLEKKDIVCYKDLLAIRVC